MSNGEVKPARMGFWKRLGWIFGIERDSARRLGVRFRRRFYFFAAFFVFILLLSGLTVYSTSPSFCRSCHIMEPYYDAWANSKHKDVACVDCHYPPGETGTILWKKFQALSQVVKYVTRTYSSKPYAEVEDSSCLRGGCHATRLLRGRVVSEQGVLFDHRPHLEEVRHGRQLRCVSCHSQVVVGKHIEVTWDTCYLCHLRGRKEGRNIEPLGGCLGCHILPDREIKVDNITYNHKDFLGKHSVACESCHQDVIQGTGDLPRDRCMTCHNQPEKLARYGEIAFLHDNHVTKHNTACFHCHQEIRHGVAKAGKKPITTECSACHSDTHDLQGEFYRGVGAKGVPSMPSPMYLANVDCVACHIVKKATENGSSHAKTETGAEKGCTNCHGAEYTGILNDVHRLTEETTLMLDGKLAAIRAVEKNLAPEQHQALEDASHNLAFIKESHSVHNIYYAAQVLRFVDGVLNEIAASTGGSVPDASKLPVISGGFCATLCHSRVGVQVPPKNVVYKGKAMPHMDHIDQGLACTICHLFGNHKEVKLKFLPGSAETPQKCFECHEKEELGK